MIPVAVFCVPICIRGLGSLRDRDMENVSVPSTALSQINGIFTTLLRSPGVNVVDTGVLLKSDTAIKCVNQWL